MHARMPVHMIPGNSDLLKAQRHDDYRSSDFGAEESAPSADMRAQFRAPADRANGNVVFRRYPDGSLDLEYAADIVMEVVERVRTSNGTDPLTHQDHAIVGCVFPPVFAPHVDHSLIASIRSVNLRITDLECMMIAMKCAQRIAAIAGFRSGV